MTTIRNLAVAAAASLVAGSLAAQQPNASAAAFGMAGNYTAAARGYDAVAWNPAALGMRDGPSFSLNLLSASGSTGLNPVKLKDFSPFGGVLIPAATKEAWLQQIGTGTENGTVEGGVNIIALNIGRIGFQLGASGAGDANLNSDAVESILFGNAGRTGSPKDFHYNGSNANGSAFVTGAVSLALPMSWKPMGSVNEQFSLGLTGKYVAGAGVGRAQDNGSVVTANNIAVRFPMIYNADASSPAGGGFGLDLGAMWSSGATTLGVSAKNVVNTFEWDTSTLRSRLGVVNFDGTNSTTDFDEAPYTSAPAAMRTALEAEKFKPEIAFGLARRMSSLLVSAEAGTRIGDAGIAIGPKSHVGVGAEFTGIPFLPLRAGVSAISGGVQGAAGFGLRLGGFELGAGVSVRTRDGGGSDTGGMLSLVSIR